MNRVSPKRLGDLINLKRGYDLPERIRVAGPYPVISSAGVSGSHNEYKVDGQGVVTGRYGTLGGMYFVEGKYWPHNTALYVQNFKGNDPKYVYYLLSCLGRIRTSTKSAVPGVNRNELHEMAVPAIENKKLQVAIRKVLEAIDKKIELNNRINAELEAIAETLYDYWFVQFDFPDANGKPYKISSGEMVYNPTLKRKIPEGWAAGTLEDLGEIVGGSTPSTQNSENFTSNGTPWITPYDLSNNQGNKFISRGAKDVSLKGIRDASLKRYPAGTVLLSSRAPIGYMAITRNESTTNQGFKSFIPSKGYSKEFIYYTVKDSIKAITQYASGSTFKEISGATLKTVEIVLPKAKITKAYTNRVQPIFLRQDLIEKETEQLTQLRDWLLPMLINGQITVSIPAIPLVEDA
ncbi:restriction endonuclease subunit S [Marinobacter sp. BSs20148]|uniref:restriction endonuclease subunit S n=1 Tax=Marinobacter sp. BSs20148 TaxID=490759 RepID=UPI00027772C6|nr:restriction endonuclease subunit S [Marinobacter sp. BSs20148]AFP32787.1 restriction modification system DNA specificity domain-containing protein [Marinobacter sp. BSs20148]